MYKNYFFLNRLVIELNDLLKNSKLVEAFSQEKDKLIFHFIDKKEDKYIEVSVNPGFPFLVIRQKFNRAKKNTVDFFNDYIPSKLINFEIADSDRIVRINLDSCSIYFTIRGKYTNIILIDNSQNVLYFKNPADESALQFDDEVSEINFRADFNIPNLKFPLNNDFFYSIRKTYPILGKEIITEAKRRSKINDSDENLKIIKNIIEEIRTEKPVVLYDKTTKQLHISVHTFGIFPYSEITEFPNMNEALGYYLSRHFFLFEFIQKSKKIQKIVDRELHKLSSKLNNLKAQIDEGSREVYYSKLGNILLINIQKMRSGMKEIELEDIYESKTQIKIKLNETLSPKQNVDYYFDRAKSDRIRIKKANELFTSFNQRYENYLNYKKQFEKAETIKELNLLMKAMNIKDENNQKDKDNLSSKFKHYLIEKKYNVYVGKDSKNNDMLTTKFAKQNDYWFHARSVPGSHVVLRVENTKEAIPKNILKKTAALAAFHSKAKTAGVAPVAYTFKKYVVKKKGMEPGKVALLKEDVLLVRPEIPKDCEYLTDE